MSTKLHEDDGTEAGWISLCDLLLLLFAVGLLLGGVLASRAKMHANAREQGEYQLGVAQDTLNKTREELREWQIRAKDVEELLGALGLESDLDPTQLRNELTQLTGRMQEAQKRLLVAESELEPERSARRQAESAQAAAELNRLQAEKALRERSEALQAIEAAAREDREMRARAESELDTLRAELRDARGRTEAMQAGLTRAERSAKEAADVAAVASRTVDQLQNAVEGQRALRQELLGIPGKMGSVVFVVDRSQSMNAEGRWEDAKRTVGAWIRYLPVERAALVAFGSGVTVIPQELELTDKTEFDSVEIPLITEAARREMILQLDSLDPEGLTATPRAMRMAMKFRDADAIFLFTDGSPEPGPNAVFAPDEEVYRLVDDWRKRNPQGRVHTVGIGDYFDRKMRSFLLTVCQKGGGTFIGR